MDDPSCRDCKHYFVTWHPETPRGCRAYGFETAQIPSAVVRKETGKPCQAWELKSSLRDPYTGTKIKKGG